MKKLIFILIVIPILLFATPNSEDQTIGILQEGPDWAVWGGTITIAAQGTTYVTTPILVGNFNIGLFELIEAESLKIQYRTASQESDLSLHSWQDYTDLTGAAALYEDAIISFWSSDTLWFFRPYLDYRIINTNVAAGTDTVELRINLKEK